MMGNTLLAVCATVAFFAGVAIFYLLGHKFGWQDGYRQARKEFGELLDEMRQDEHEVEEEMRALKRQIGGIERMAQNLDNLDDGR